MRSRLYVDFNVNQLVLTAKSGQMVFDLGSFTSYRNLGDASGK